MNTAVLFDLDGVIIDSRAAIREALHTITFRVFGREIQPHLLDAQVGVPPVQALCLLGVPDPEDAYERMFDAALFDAAHHIRVIPAVVAGITALAQSGVKIGIVTTQARRRLYFLVPPVVGMVASVVIAWEDAEPKPAPDGITLACSRLGVAAESALFVGDTVSDLAAGRAAGVKTVSVAWGFTDPNALARAGAEIVLDEPRQIGPELLEFLPNPEAGTSIA
ncbi:MULTISPECIES: HAD family hydrolase [unclassified Nocardia]|uniref:HAD family hydrolase n=1 Tax=unclassified Nocardia TaxID=2637762 RepID=UPI00278C3C8F|nr:MULTISPECIES: HAD-IA family hydrolase [unclassified Nocardia]